MSRYIRYKIRNVQSGVVGQVYEFLDLKSCEEECKEINLAQAQAGQLDRVSAYTQIQWFLLCSDIIIIALCMTMVYAFVTRDLTLAVFAFMLRCMLFGIPVVHLKQL